MRLESHGNHPTTVDLREPPLLLGNLVVLRSGGPRMMVVDTDGETVVTAWRDGEGCCEASFPTLCLHRVSPF